MCLYIAISGIFSFLPSIILGMLIGGRGDSTFAGRIIQSLPYSFGIWIVLSAIGAVLFNLWLQRKAKPILQRLKDKGITMQDMNTQTESDNVKTPSHGGE